MIHDDDQRGPRQQQQGQQAQQGARGGQQQQGGFGGEQRGNAGQWQRDQQQGQNFGGSQSLTNVAEVAMRGGAMLVDLQMEVMRNVWQTQARSASLLGVPDFSSLFEAGDDRGRRLFSTSAEQLLATMRHATDTMLAVQREVSRLAQQQAFGLTDQMHEQVQSLGEQARRSLDELQQMTVQQTETASRFLQDAQNRGQPSARGNGGADEGRHTGGAQGRGSEQQRAGQAGGMNDAEPSIVVVGGDAPEIPRKEPEGDRRGGDKRRNA